MDQPPDAVTRALAQPHIVQSICLSLPVRMLVTAALINRTFFAEVTETQWKDAPLWILRACVQPSRRQLYASKIRHLELDLDDIARSVANHSFIKRLTFDSLRVLVLSTCNASPDDDHMFLARYFGPALRALTLKTGAAHASLFSLLGGRCNRLSSLSLGRARVDLMALAQFMATSRYLRYLEWAGDHDSGTLPLAFVQQCARQPSLRELLLSTTTIGVRSLLIIHLEIYRPFAALERFTATLPSNAMSLLCGCLAKTEEIELELIDLISPVLEPLSQLQGLKKIRLRIPSTGPFSASEMMSLCSLVKLQEFCTFIVEDVDDTPQYDAVSQSSHSSSREYASLGLAASQFKTWVSHFPSLQRLELCWAVPGKYDEALVALASHCPMLEYCRWPAEIDFSALQLGSREQPLFPNLVCLSAPSATASDDPNDFPCNLDKSQLVEVVKKHFPKMRVTLIIPKVWGQGVSFIAAALAVLSC